MYISTISNREKEVLDLVAQGLSNKEIAEHLNISISTVQNHISKIYEKLGVNNRTKASRIYIQVTGIKNS